MVDKIKTCVFISGKGSNLKYLIKNSKYHDFPISVNLVISNKKKARGLFIAKKYSIPCKYFSSKNKKKFEEKSLIEIKKRKIKFICLAGFMKVLSNNFIKSFGNKIVNIHPSLLPKYKGLDAHKRVIENKEKYSGCTVHFVTSKLDSGKIILQKKIKIKKNETIHSLKVKTLKEEHKLYSRSIISIFK